MTVVAHPLAWYVDRLAAGMPTVSLLYGDGEFVACDPTKQGETLQNSERVTRLLADELRASLRPEADGPDLLRASDPSLLDWRTYGGRDVECVKAMCGHALVAQKLSRPEGPPVEWLDGRVWDEAVRSGELNPFLKWLNAQRGAVLVGHPNLVRRAFPWPSEMTFLAVPKANAADRLEETWAAVQSLGRRHLYVLCCGLGAIPLAMRARRFSPGCSALDLGSTFDVFFDLGRERGWRNEIYNDSRALKALRRANLDGLNGGEP